jgi:protein SCO1/2
LVSAIFFVGLLATALAVLWSFIREGAPPVATLPIYQQLTGFTLTNQAGEVVTLETLRGRLWVADIIFTRCAGPCPKMTANMSRLHDALAGNPKVSLVTLTADPVNDTPEVLQHYAERYGSRGPQWQFLTGDKQQIQNLAIKGFKLALVESPNADRQAGEDLFIHSTKFILVDAVGRIRGYYEGLEPESQKKLLHDVNLVLRKG